jgi:ATP-dependent exoDNAse (exonuclease V) alpha subunit
VGDSRQLSSVGPGGALAHATDRHAGQMYVLDGAVRFYTAGEAEALEQLRDGKIATWAAWARQHDRIHGGATRDEVLDGMVAAWAQDVAEGHQSEMYAWRRSDVAAFNLRAREAMATMGLVAEDTVEAPDGTGYEVGDRIVLATSGRGTVRSAKVDRDGTVTLEAEITGGRRWTFTGDELDDVAPAWAVTAHRSQGATVGRGHVLFESGVERSLLYVRLSRGWTPTPSASRRTTSTRPSPTFAGSKTARSGS